MDNAITIALSRLTTQQRALDVIAANIANSSSPGYKAERPVFADWLISEPHGGVAPGDSKLAFSQTRATYRENTEGTLTHTSNPLDLAISGDGYFTVETKAGPRLTRAGRFTLATDGTVVDESGNPLLDTAGKQIKISTADTDLTVKSDGTISSENGSLGQIGVVMPKDPNRLTAEGARLLRADVPTAPVAAPKIIQGALEDSDVQPIAEVTRMISTQRDFQFVAQFVESEGQRQQNAIDKIAAPAAS